MLLNVWRRQCAKQRHRHFSPPFIVHHRHKYRKAIHCNKTRGCRVSKSYVVFGRWCSLCICWCIYVKHKHQDIKHMRLHTPLFWWIKCSSLWSAWFRCVVWNSHILQCRCSVKKVWSQASLCRTAMGAKHKVTSRTRCNSIAVRHTLARTVFHLLCNSVRSITRTIFSELW